MDLNRAVYVASDELDTSTELASPTNPMNVSNGAVLSRGLNTSIDSDVSMSDFETERSLGRGTYGRVVQARHRPTNKKYAIKSAPLMGVGPARQRMQDQILKEIRLTSKVHHPNIIGYKKAFYSGDSIHIVLEYAEGGTLMQKVQGLVEKYGEGTILAEADVLRYFVQVCLAVQHLHSLNIMHRDLKSSNIFLTEDETVKLGDFGISKEMERSFAMTQAGSPFYVCPEIVQNLPYSFKGDMWSLGVVLYELMSGGKVPFPDDGQGMIGLLQAILHKNPRPLSTSYSQELRDICSSLLSKRPEDRPAIDELLAQPIMQRAYVEHCSDAHRSAVTVSMMTTHMASIDGLVSMKRKGQHDVDKIERDLQQDAVVTPSQSGSSTTTTTTTYEYVESPAVAGAGAGAALPMHAPAPAPIPVSAAAPVYVYSASPRHGHHHQRVVSQPAYSSPRNLSGGSAHYGAPIQSPRSVYASPPMMRMPPRSGPGPSPLSQRRGW